MPFQSSARGKYGPQGMKAMKGPLAPVWSTSGTLTQAQPGTAYSFQLVASDDSGDAPTYSLNTGSIPAGLSISSSGLISGTPSNSGTFTFTVNATDANGRATSSSTLTIVSVVPFAPAGTGQRFTSTGTQNYTITTQGTYFIYCVGAGGQNACGSGGAGAVTATKLYFSSGSVVQVGVGMVGNPGYEMGGGTTGAAGGAGSFVKYVSGTVLTGTGGSAVSSPAGNYLVVAGGGGSGGCHSFTANFGGNGNGQGGAQYDNNPPDNGCGGFSGWNGGGGGSTCHGGSSGGGTSNSNQYTGAQGNTQSGNYGGSGGGGFGGGGGGASGCSGCPGNTGGVGSGWVQDGSNTNYFSYRRGGGGGGSHPNSCGGSGGGGGGLILGDPSDSRFAYPSYRVTPNRTTSNGSYDRGLSSVMNSLGRSDIASIGSYGANTTQGAVWIVASGG